MVTTTRLIAIEKLYLDKSNPRHEPFNTEQEAIKYLCEKEYVFPLAQDIVLNGINPLESFAVIPDDSKAAHNSSTFVVAEGNRRICALKLLIDPDLAPPNLRENFRNLAEGWTTIDSVPCTLFSSREKVKLWLDRIHGGTQGGRGRKDWNSDQKERFLGTNKNRLAMLLLDYAELHGLISKKDRAGKLTTVQRFVGNAVFRETLGVDASIATELRRTRPEADFNALLKRFLDEIVAKTINSRADKDDVAKYARTLPGSTTISGTRIEPEALGKPAKGAQPAATGKQQIKKPQKPTPEQFIAYNEQIMDDLKKLDNKKLQSLYYSICNAKLSDHAPLLAVGVWSFLESLTALAGRPEGNDFYAFLNAGRLSGYGLGDKATTKTMRDALETIQKNGNASKHHQISATFYGEQLANDMKTITPVIIACTKEALSNN